MSRVGGKLAVTFGFLVSTIVMAGVVGGAGLRERPGPSLVS